MESFIDNSNLLFKGNNISVGREKNSHMFFEIFYDGYHVDTIDPIEGVSLMMKNPDWENLKLWEEKLEKSQFEKNQIKIVNAIWLLAGGENTWREYNIELIDFIDIFLNNYSLEIYNIYLESNTLGELKEILKKQFNLDRFYESILCFNRQYI